ncbi:MAG: hypothetical protein J5733_09440, partial [Bacteroidaceae bacterium]|nr:hypothetical protein [Bacteroidaceae bacterium]
MTTLQQEIVVVIGDPNIFIPESDGMVYTEPLYVTINGEPSEPRTANVTVYYNSDGTVNFELKNFFFNLEGFEAPVGTIFVENIPAREGDDGLLYLEYDGSITIQDGDLEGVDMWVGPMLGPIDISLKGKMSEDKLFVTIDMPSAMGQTVFVQLGTDDFGAAGKEYTEQLLVTINGEQTEPRTATVTVYDNNDGTVNFELKNFFFNLEGFEAPVGTIFVENVSVTEGEDGLQYLAYDGSVTIQEGDLEGVDMWVGPMLGPIDISLKGKMNEDKLFVTIDMPNAMGQAVFVQLGTDDFAPKPEKTYTEQYVVTVNGEKQEPQTTDIKVVDNGNGTINFVLPDFVLHTEAMDFHVGDISLENVPAEEDEDGLVHFSSVEGSTFSVSDTNIPSELSFMAQYFKNIPYTLNGKLSEESLYATINIDMANLGYDIFVEVGTDNSYAAGDVNQDGSTDIADAVTVLNAMAGEEVAGNADVNGDGVVDIADFVTVLNIMAGEVVE